MRDHLAKLVTELHFRAAQAAIEAEPERDNPAQRFWLKSTSELLAEVAQRIQLILDSDGAVEISYGDGPFPYGRDPRKH